MISSFLFLPTLGTSANLSLLDPSREQPETHMAKGLEGNTLQEKLLLLSGAEAALSSQQ